MNNNIKFLLFLSVVVAVIFGVAGLTLGVWKMATDPHMRKLQKVECVTIKEEQK